MTKPISLTTAQMVDLFKAGRTMEDIAAFSGVSVLKVEQALRRWLEVYTLYKG
jgi:hypothetical protein